MKTISKVGNFFLLLISMASAHIGWCQSTVDSLKAELELAQGKKRVGILIALSKQFQNLDPNQAFDFAEDAINLSQQIAFDKGEASGYINLGSAHRKIGNYDQSIEAYHEALRVSQENQNTKDEARAYNGLGIAYNMKGDFDKALIALFSALRIDEQNNDKQGMADALNNIGIIYWYSDDLDMSLEYYLKALELRKEIGDKNDIAASMNNIGNTYSTLGEHQKSLQYFLDALEIQEEMGNIEVIFALRLNIGTVYADLNDHEEALTYYLRGLEISEARGDNWGTAQCFNYIGLAYMNLQETQKAEDYLLKSLELAERIGAKSIKQENYSYLSDLYQAKSNFQRSLKYFKLYSIVKDSIFNEASSKQMAELQTRYEKEKDKAAIQELTSQSAVQELKLRKSENLKLFFIISSILIMILAAVMYYGFQQNRKANIFLKERNKLEIENKERAISLFGQQVSKQVASELLSGSFQSSGKKLFACIMFLDIRNYTPFIQNKEPSEIIQYQNDVFGFMIDVISRHHGIINQFLGDGFMATFGAPASSAHDCSNAVLALIEIVDLLKKKCASGKLPTTRIGIGLHAGSIVTGNVGTSERKQYSISGNTVVLASRIEQLNKQFKSEILISREVLEKIDRSNLHTENLGSVHVKGRAKPIEIIRIHGTV